LFEHFPGQLALLKTNGILFLILGIVQDFAVAGGTLLPLRASNPDQQPAANHAAAYMGTILEKR
jgi:hypothetical protein